MSAHLQRAELLLAQSRPADAEREARQALLSAPENPSAHGLLALCLAGQEKLPEALEAARTAIGFAPDVGYFHYIHAHVLHRLDRERDALEAVHEAIRLDPDSEDNFALLSSVHLAQRDWKASLEAAERGLALNPEHTLSANLRAMALVRLGRNSEAVDTIDFALERAPENAFSHANQGWNCLHRNDPRKAQEHFREALRLQPDLEYARQGMLEALKARNPIYRGMLAYFLWMGRLSTKLQWAFVIVTFFGVRMVRGLAESQPQLGWVLWPLLVLFYVFIYLSWTTGPMFNLLLRLNKFGRLVLSHDERVASNWFGAAFGLAVISAIFWALGGDTLGAVLTIMLGMLSVCVAAVFGKQGRSRMILAMASGALTLVGITAVALIVLNNRAALSILPVFVFGFLGYQILASTLRR
jgi:Tfp pilus assembly protein PilF